MKVLDSSLGWGARVCAVICACSFAVACGPAAKPRTRESPGDTADAAVGFQPLDAATPMLDASQTPEVLDLDGDGLSNEYELANGLNPNTVDSDGDGVSDLAEFVAGTNGADAADNPMAKGDFYFTSPYNAPPSPDRAPLVFATALQSADLFILVDTTGSMGGAITQLQAQLSATIVPAVSMLVNDLQIGVGHFDDMPVGAYGAPPDEVLGINQTVTDSTTAAQAGVTSLVLHGGGDLPEGAVPALHALASGMGLGTLLPNAPACPDGRLGYACFRPGAVPIVLLITDAEFHNGPSGEYAYGLDVVPTPPTYQHAVDALALLNARVISVLLFGSGGEMPPVGYLPADHLTRLSQDTGAVDVDGKPFLFTVGQDAAGLDTRVINAVQAVAEQVPIEVSVVVRDDPTDTIDATKLIERVEPNTVGGLADPRDPTRVCEGGLSVADTDSDGYADTFTGILPGTPLCFDVIPRMNDIVTSTTMPALYKAFIDVVADGTSVLDTREVLFLIPPSTPIVD
jgi:hypothetical protein